MTIKFADLSTPSPPPSQPSPTPALKPRKSTRNTKTSTPPTPLLPDWAQKAKHASLSYEVYNRIEHLRRLMLVHCCIYYKLGDNIVSDHTWQEWAWELARLQDKHGYAFGFYDDQFKDWDGSTGYHLRYDDGVTDKAIWLLRQRDMRHVESNPTETH